MTAAGKACIKGAQEMRVGGSDTVVTVTMSLLPLWLNSPSMIKFLMKNVVTHLQVSFPDRWKAPDGKLDGKNGGTRHTLSIDMNISWILPKLRPQVQPVKAGLSVPRPVSW